LTVTPALFEIPDNQVTNDRGNGNTLPIRLIRQIIKPEGIKPEGDFLVLIDTITGHLPKPP